MAIVAHAPNRTAAMRNTLLLAACLLTPTLAHAACADLMERWDEQLAPDRVLHGAFATCKAWPANPALTLAALPYQRPGSTDADGVDDLLLVVGDSKTGKVLAQLLQPSAISYDGLRLSGIALDTARYQVTPAQRAFGVRIEHATGPSFPFSQTALNLYVIEGKTLRPVLNQLVVGTFQRESDGNCAGTASDMSRAISMGAPGEAGYAALQVAEQAKDTVATASGEQCVEKDGPVQRKTYTLDYRGGQYVVPKALRYAQ